MIASVKDRHTKMQLKTTTYENNNRYEEKDIKRRWAFTEGKFSNSEGKPRVIANIERKEEII